MLPRVPQIETPGGIALEYEAFGSPADPPLLMVAGYTMQLIGWPREFAQLLADGGRHVIVYDNRDNGLSRKFDGVASNIEQVAAAALQVTTRQQRHPRLTRSVTWRMTVWVC